jgi:hypothetical protein
MGAYRQARREGPWRFDYHLAEIRQAEADLIATELAANFPWPPNAA